MLQAFNSKTTFRRAKNSLLDMYSHANPEGREYLRSVLHDLYFAIEVALEAAPEAAAPDKHTPPTNQG